MLHEQDVLSPCTEGDLGQGHRDYSQQYLWPPLWNLSSTLSRLADTTPRASATQWQALCKAV